MSCAPANRVSSRRPVAVTEPRRAQFCFTPAASCGSGNRTQITLSIAPDLLREVDAIAQRKHLSRAALLTVWLGEKVEQDKERAA